MSKYTTEVRFICEQAAGLTQSAGYSSVNDVISAAIPKIFDFSFPLFDEDYRSVLCTKILKHYYTREIAAESVGLWKLWLDTRLNEIMPYYNKLYQSEILEFNPLHDTNLTTTHDGRDHRSDANTDRATENSEGANSRSGTSKQNATSTGTDTSASTQNTSRQESSSNQDLYSDTPQGSLQNIDSETYLTNARKTMGSGTSGEDTSASSTVNSTNSGETTGESAERGGFSEERKSEKNYSGTTDGTTHYLQSVVGKSSGSSFSKMLEEYRATFINIDMMIIKDLEDLFFNLW